METDSIDIRTVPSGTLIYNLIRCTAEELGIEGMLHHHEMTKHQNKMIVDPPEVLRAKEMLTAMQNARYKLANEVNIRFQSADAMRIATANIDKTPE